VSVLDAGGAKRVADLQPGQDGRWTGVIVLDGGRCAAAGLYRTMAGCLRSWSPHDCRLIKASNWENPGIT
jgi:hypothetical protein